MDMEQYGSSDICIKFPHLVWKSWKVDYLMQQLLKDTGFIKLLTALESESLKSFVLIVENFLGNQITKKFGKICCHTLAAN